MAFKKLALDLNLLYIPSLFNLFRFFPLHSQSALRSLEEVRIKIILNILGSSQSEQEHKDKT